MDKLRSLAEIIAGWVMILVYITLIFHLTIIAWKFNPDQPNQKELVYQSPASGTTTQDAKKVIELPEGAVTVATLGSGLVAAVVAALLGQPAIKTLSLSGIRGILTDHRAILWGVYLAAYVIAGIACGVTWISKGATLHARGFELPEFYKANALVFLGLMGAVVRSFLVPPKP